MTSAAKRFLKKHGHSNSRFQPILDYASEQRKLGQDIDLVGMVTRHSNHYYHANTVTADVYCNNFPDTENDKQTPDLRAVFVSGLIDELEEFVREDVKGLCHEIYRQLEADYDYLTSESQVIEALNANDMLFDEEGDLVSLSDFSLADRLPADVQQDVISNYAELFD